MDMTTIGMAIAIAKSMPDTAASRAETAAEAAAASAEAAAQHSMGVSVSGHTLVFENVETEE